MIYPCGIWVETSNDKLLPGDCASGPRVVAGLLPDEQLERQFGIKGESRPFRNIGAVENAPAPFGIKINEAPISPQRIAALIDAKRPRGASS